MVDRRNNRCEFLNVVKWPEFLPQFLRIARVRAVEESGEAARIWDEAAVRKAVSESVVATSPPSPGGADERLESMLFMAERAAKLEASARDRSFLRGLGVPAVPVWLSIPGLILAFLIGWWLADFGDEREINILSLPLITIILWNLIVIVLSLFHGVKGDVPSAPRWLVALHDRLAARREPSSDWSAPVRARFREIAWPPMLQRLGFRSRAWLHLAAALFGLGSIASILSHGWARDYRAVWESTLLSEGGARAFFGALFAPASWLLHREIPLDDLAAMHRTALSPAAQPGEALPWISLYLATLEIFVVIPRLLLAALERWRARGIAARALQSDEWREYASRVRDFDRVSGAPVSLLAHGLNIDDGARDRWRKLVHTRWRDLGPLECTSIAVGREGEFADAWSPASSRVLVVFNLSSTPEDEVHRALLEKLAERAKLAKSAVTLAVTLDDAGLRKRWTGLADGAERLEARIRSWRDVLRGLPFEWI